MKLKVCKHCLSTNYVFRLLLGAGFISYENMWFTDFTVLSFGVCLNISSLKSNVRATGEWV